MWAAGALGACIRWLDLLALAAVVGGLALEVLVLPAGRESPQAAWVAAAARRFSRLAGVCAATVVVTGIVNTWTELDALSALWTSPYGRVLTAKVVLVLGTLTLGAINRYRVLPTFGSTAEGARWANGVPARAGATPTLSTWVAREAVLVLLVYGCTALLGQLAPPRHRTGQHGAPGHVAVMDLLRGRRGAGCEARATPLDRLIRAERPA